MGRPGGSIKNASRQWRPGERVNHTRDVLIILSLPASLAYRGLQPTARQRSPSAAVLFRRL